MYECTLCTYSCKHKGDLKRHSFIHTGEKPFKCSLCTYACRQKNNLNIHLLTHTGEKPHKCAMCSYECTTSAHLKRHLATHTGEKSYKCSLCSYACTTRGSLKRHFTTHTGEKPFNCSLCSYECTTSGSLKRHILVHTGEKPYKCSLCSYACTDSGSLKKHVLSHTGEKPYKCSYCSYACTSNKCFKKHLLNHTDEMPLSEAEEMLTLPEEVLEIIVAHLTAKELAACCGVSLGWRELFNKDIFWKRFCDKRLPEYLRTISSRVTPRFVIPQNSNSDLTPLCDWRLSYMREAHLWANLLEGRHTIEYLDSEVNSVIIQCKFLKNDFLLTLGSKIVVYDIRATPVIYVENPIRLLPMHSVDLCEVFGDRIVIVQYFVVQVYHINLVLQNWPQERIFVYNQDTECTFEENQDINSHILGLPLCARKPVCKIIGNIFLGSDQINGSIHIWDLKTGKKIKEEVFKLALSSRFIEFKPSTTCKTEIVVVLKQNMADGECFLFLVYNLQSFEFYPLAKSYSRYSQCLLFGEHLAIVSFNNLQILNYKTCEMIRELFSESVTIDVWKNNIVFNEGKNLRRFLSSAEEVTLLELDMKIVHFKLFNDKFLRVSVKGDGKQDWQGQMCGWNIEIERTYWNIGNDWKKIIQFPFRVNDLCVNEPCTKIVASVIGLPWVLINYW